VQIRVIRGGFSPFRFRLCSERRAGNPASEKWATKQQKPDFAAKASYFLRCRRSAFLLLSLAQKLRLCEVESMCARILPILILIACGINSPVHGQTSSGSPLSRISTAKSNIDDADKDLRFTDYEARLNAILKTRRDEEKKFVSEVMALVRNGVLPERLIETSYKWVMNKRPGTDYPFIYFERVLRIQAAVMKLEIPAFDYSIYDQRLFQAGSKKIPVGN
jgi:hypothetical protein